MRPGLRPGVMVEVTAQQRDLQPGLEWCYKKVGVITCGSRPAGVKDSLGSYTTGNWKGNCSEHLDHTVGLDREDIPGGYALATLSEEFLRVHSCNISCPERHPCLRGAWVVS